MIMTMMTDDDTTINYHDQRPQVILVGKEPYPALLQTKDVALKMHHRRMSSNDNSTVLYLYSSCTSSHLFKSLLNQLRCHCLQPGRDFQSVL